jgi:hypothetical protein
VATVLTYVAVHNKGWRRPFIFLERNATMHEPDFCTQSAEAMELTIEGNRLIAQEIAALVRDLWHRVGRALAAQLSAQHRHLPPV